MRIPPRPSCSNPHLLHHVLKRSNLLHQNLSPSQFMAQPYSYQRRQTPSTMLVYGCFLLGFVVASTSAQNIPEVSAVATATATATATYYPAYIPPASVIFRRDDSCPANTFRCSEELGERFRDICCQNGQTCAVDADDEPACCPSG